MLYSNNYENKYKFGIGASLPDIYSKELVMDSDIQTEVIWLHGSFSEFKNQFIWQLIEDLSFQYKKNLFGSFLQLPIVKVS